MAKRHYTEYEAILGKPVWKFQAYPSYRSMISRCHNPRNTEYKRYGAKGIVVCRHWLDSFVNFLEDMGERPPKFTLERIDFNGNYYKENCQWVSKADQQRNKSNTIFVEWEGNRVCLAEACRRAGMNYQIALNRIWRGWDAHKALTKKPVWGRFA